MQIIVETNNPSLAFAPDFPIGVKRSVYHTRDSSSLVNLFKIVFELAFDVGAGVFAAYIYEKTKNKKKQILKINSVEIKLEGGEVDRITIQEVITKQKD